MYSAGEFVSQMVIWLKEPAFADYLIAIRVVRVVIVVIPDTVMVAVAVAGSAITISRVSATISVIAVINNATR
jgi:hypothetical protein